MRRCSMYLCCVGRGGAALLCRRERLGRSSVNRLVSTSMQPVVPIRSSHRPGNSARTIGECVVDDIWLQKRPAGATKSGGIGLSRQFVVKRLGRASASSRVHSNLPPPPPIFRSSNGSRLVRKFPFRSKESKDQLQQQWRGGRSCPPPRGGHPGNTHILALHRSRVNLARLQHIIGLPAFQACQPLWIPSGPRKPRAGTCRWLVCMASLG